MVRTFNKDGFDILMLYVKGDLEFLDSNRKNRQSVISPILHGSYYCRLLFEMEEQMNPVDPYAVLYSVGIIKDEEKKLFNKFDFLKKNYHNHLETVDPYSVLNLLERFAFKAERVNDSDITLEKFLDHELDRIAYNLHFSQEEPGKLILPTDLNRSSFGRFIRDKQIKYYGKHLHPKNKNDKKDTMKKRFKENITPYIGGIFLDSFFKKPSLPDDVKINPDFTTLDDDYRRILKNLDIKRKTPIIIHDGNKFITTRFEVPSSRFRNESYGVDETINKQTNEITYSCQCKGFDYRKDCSHINHLIDLRKLQRNLN